jgi:hypothetical protein
MTHSFKVKSTHVDPQTKALVVEIESGDKFSISKHQGKDAIRSARMIQRINSGALKIMGELRAETDRKMSADDREKMQALVEKYIADDLLDKEKKALEKEMDEISEKYEDQAAKMKAMAEIQGNIDPDIEDELDALLFKYTFAAGFGALSDASKFNDCFSGERWELIPIIRNLIVEHNNFLGQGPKKAQEEAAASK